MHVLPMLPRFGGLMKGVNIYAGMMLALVLSTPAVAAGQKAPTEAELPLWELGLGGGAFSLPQYMGSDERYNLPFVFPYLIYRGERWRLDRGGLRNRLMDGSRFSLDASFSFGLPVRNSNRARQGMPRLYLSGEAGPQLNVALLETEHDDVSLRLPVRAAFNVRGKSLGWVSEPFVRYQWADTRNDGWLRTRLDVGALYASRRFNDNYYGVAPAYVTATRPGYVARAGLHSVFAKLNVRYPVSRDWQLFSTVQVRSMASGVVANSPLVKNKTYTSVSAGVIWTWRRAGKDARNNEEEY